MGRPLVEPKAPGDTSPETSSLAMILTMGIIGLLVFVAFPDGFCFDAFE